VTDDLLPGPPTAHRRRRIDRERFLSHAHGHTTGIVADTAEGRFLFDVTDRTVGGLLFANESRSEIATLAAVLQLVDHLAVPLPPRSVAIFVDIGANIGTTIVPALRSGRFARGVAVEPEPRNQRLLRANLALNDLHDRVQIITAAAGQTPGAVCLELHPTNSGGHEIANPLAPTSFQQNGIKSTGRLQVDMVSLDALVGERALDPDAVGLIWIDAQGYEGHILSGAAELTSRGVPVVVEFWPTALRGSGGLQLVLSTLQRHYTHFVDLRQLVCLGPPQMRTVDELSVLASELESERRAESDLLVLRRPSASTTPTND
jgi:FkbM family methyltransferase